MPTRYLTNKLLYDVVLGKNLGVSEWTQVANAPTTTRFQTIHHKKFCKF